MRLGPLIIFFLLVPSLGHAEINHFEDHLITGKVFLALPGMDFDFKSQLTGRLVRWKPNTRANFGVGISVRDFIGVSLSTTTAMTQEDRIAKGDTTYQDWRLFYNFRRLSFIFNYQEYRGFYIDNSSQIDSSYANTPSKIQDADMTARNYSVNFTYIVAPEDFSIQAALDQTSRQESSGGSVLIGAAASHTIFNNDRYLIPSAVQSEFGPDQKITSGTFTTVIMKAGYGYTWVAPNKKYFASGIMMLGFGNQSSRYADPVKQYSSNKTTSKGDISVSTGYSGDINFGGFNLFADATSYTTETLNITSNLYSLTFFWGKRF